MNRLQIWALLSIFFLLLSAGCIAKSEPFDPVNNNAAGNDALTEKATSVPETAAPPTSVKDNRTIRLTPLATPELERVPTSAIAPVVGEVPQAIMTAVYKDLLTHANVQKETISIVRTEAVIWNDGALGCPQPDGIYTQEPIEGYWVILKSGAETFDYRVRQNGTFLLCEQSLKYNQTSIEQ